MKDQSKTTHSTGLQNSDKPQSEATPTSTPISASLAMHLFELSKKVTADQITPETVRAACACASEIHKLVDLQMRAKKQGA
jgi:uncharacterized protein HemY